MREVRKHCDTCNYSYMERESSGPRQKCRSPEYNAETYTHDMFMEDWGQSHCRFWTPPNTERIIL